MWECISMLSDHLSWPIHRVAEGRRFTWQARPALRAAVLLWWSPDSGITPSLRRKVQPVRGSPQTSPDQSHPFSRLDSVFVCLEPVVPTHVPPKSGHIVLSAVTKETGSKTGMGPCEAETQMLSVSASSILLFLLCSQFDRREEYLYFNYMAMNIGILSGVKAYCSRSARV